MQHIVNRLVSFVVFLLVITEAKAQHGDSVKIKTDSASHYGNADWYNKQHRNYAAQDSFNRMHAYKMHRFNDSLRRYKRYQDSVYRKTMRRAYAAHDSFKRMQTYKMHRFNDSLRRYKHYQDSGYRKNRSVYRKLDTMHRFNHYSDSAYKKNRFRSYMSYDSLKKRYNDSAYRKHQFYVYRKMDSLKLKQLKMRIVQDSMRMKMYKEQRDSIYKKLKEREVVMELPAKNIQKIFINHYYQDIVIRTGDTRKVKLVTTVYEHGKMTLSDKEWFDKLKTSIQSTDSGVTIMANASVEKKMLASHSTSTQGTYTLLLQLKDTDKAEQYNMPRKILRIDVPRGMAIDIVSRYSNVTLDNDMNDLSVNISNGKLLMRNATNAVIRSRYGAVQAGNITNANIQLTNGKFDCTGIDNLQIDSKYSKVNFASAGKINMKSQSDRYELQQVNNIEGVKTFGQLNIQNLLTDMVLKGSSADINVGNFGVNAVLVNISNKYADVKLPVKKLLNYSLNFGGINSRFLGKPDSMAVGLVLSPLNNGNSGRSFTASAGNLAGLHTKLQLDCNSCVVDLR